MIIERISMNRCEAEKKDSNMPRITIMNFRMLKDSKKYARNLAKR